MDRFGDEWQRVTALCLTEKSKNPIEIMCKLMDLDFCNMKGHEHHMMVGAALLTAYFNAENAKNPDRASEDASMKLSEAFQRLETVEEFDAGGDCDYWKQCKSINGVRAFWSVISDRNDLVIMLTMEAANAVGSVGGQRCCKRSAYLAISAAVEFVKKHLGTEMETEEFVCRYSNKNSSCLTEDCPFNEHYIEF